MLILRPQFHRRVFRRPNTSRARGVSLPAQNSDYALELLLAHFRQEGLERRKAQGRFRYITYVALGVVCFAWFSDLITGQFSFEWMLSHWLVYIVVLGAACMPIGISHVQREIAHLLTQHSHPKAIGALLQAREFGEPELSCLIDQAILRIMAQNLDPNLFALSRLERKALHKALHDAGLELVEALLPLAVSNGDRETLQTLSRLTSELFMPQQQPLKRAVEQAMESLVDRLDTEAMPQYLLRSTNHTDAPQSLLRPAKDTLEPTLLLRTLSTQNDAFSSPLDETTQSVGTSNR